jgi:SAM-dependent methyltransferase
MKQNNVSSENEKFWDELCGSQLAKVLNINDTSPHSLKKFDDWYFNFYPYLNDYIPFADLKCKDVLEVGLGYGTVSQKIAESGSNYKGLDIAAGPVDMVNHRLEQNGLSGAAVQASILEPPFEKNSFDVIVAIGCLHHTGNLKEAIKQCHQLLRNGGKLIFMVYYAYSYRRFIQAPIDTFNYLLSEVLLGKRDVVSGTTTRHRAAYDVNKDGEGAPHTDWISKRSLKKMCYQFSTFDSRIENIDNGTPFQPWTRVQLLGTKIPRLVGLDLYAVACK